MKNKILNLKATIAISLILFSCISINAKAKKSITAEEALQQGREAFFAYDFEKASDLYTQYRTLKTKAKQSLDEDFEVWEQELEVAESALERVQKIVIIDSLAVPRGRFYQSYRLSLSAGDIGPHPKAAEASGLNSREVSFLNEDKDLLISPQEDEEGYLRFKEGRKLLDGSWETEDYLQGNFEKEGDYAFPFLSGDGQTFYFSNNGPESMGGYDIFVAQREPITGEFLQPLNIGMPFNSPHDDIMMAIDEERGIGWWATDRNSLDDEVTIYVYLFDEVRKNYPSDYEFIREAAQIRNYHDTWEDGKEKEYENKLKLINN